MPSTSRDQQVAAAIAEHHPEELYNRNKAMLAMNDKQLHEFAATKTKSLPIKVKAHVRHLKK